MGLSFHNEATMADTSVTESLRFTASNYADPTPETGSNVDQEPQETR